MTHFFYGSKNGVSTVIRLTIKLCSIYVLRAAGIKAYVNASSLDVDQKEFLTTWLDNIVTACELLTILEKVYEA